MADPERRHSCVRKKQLQHVEVPVKPITPGSHSGMTSTGLLVSTPETVAKKELGTSSSGGTVGLGVLGRGEELFKGGPLMRTSTAGRACQRLTIPGRG